MTAKPKKVVAIRPPSVQHLMEKAIDQDKVGELERLIEMQNKEEAKQAKRVFYESFTALQAECPPVIKHRTAGQWKFADLTDILEVVGPLLQKYGFSYHLPAPYNRETECVEATCEIHHIGGHEYKPEPVSMPMDPESFGNKNQQTGSAISYAKRNAFVAAFGILTADADDDGKASGDAVNTVAQMEAKARRLMEAVLRNSESILIIKERITTGDIPGAVQLLHEIEDEDRLALRISHKRGGPWSPEEIRIMRGEDWQTVWNQMT